MSGEVRAAAGAREVAAALALRHEVFCGEQGVTEADELDGRDGEALHLVAVEEGRVVGTCRVLLDGGIAKFGRLAVERAARGRGLADSLLALAEERARAAGAGRMALHAQIDARGLYDRRGYVPLGDPFEEAGILHVTMEKRLA